MGTLANSEDPDEMQHNQGLHCLLRLKRYSGTVIHDSFKKFYLWFLKVHNGQTHIIVSICTVKSIRIQKVKNYVCILEYVFWGQIWCLLFII